MRHADCLDVRQQHENLVWRTTVYPKQKKENQALHSGIKTSPYEAMFGTAQRIGLGDSPLTEDSCPSIETEEELEQLFNVGMNNGRDKEDKEEANQQERKNEDENKKMTIQKKE